MAMAQCYTNIEEHAHRPAALGALSSTTGSHQPRQIPTAATPDAWNGRRGRERGASRPPLAEGGQYWKRPERRQLASLPMEGGSAMLHTSPHGSLC